ncbi:hypothetical protein ACPZMI_01595, partial [Pseudomonas wayambapalatensis]|uniref:hypothetical protein n=1 Tax=Pseudomonas wayambapalatensis TaxID=485895 RepID=UPI003CF72F61
GWPQLDALFGLGIALYILFEKDTALHGTGYARVRGTSPLPQGLGWPLDFEQDSCSYGIQRI